MQRDDEETAKTVPLEFDGDSCWDASSISSLECDDSDDDSSIDSLDADLDMSDDDEEEDNESKSLVDYKQQQQQQRRDRILSLQRQLLEAERVQWQAARRVHQALEKLQTRLHELEHGAS